MTTQQRATTDTALRVLSARPRRAAVRRIGERDGTVTVTQLAAALRDRGAGPPGADASTELAIELRHVHLPMLADAGVIAYDRDDGTVQRGRRFAGVRSLLRAIDRHQANASNARS